MNDKKPIFDGGIVAVETPKRYEVPKHVKSINGKQVNNFEEFGVYEDDDIMEEVVEMPTSLLKRPEDMPEMPDDFEKPKKSRAGRKPRRKREALHTSLEMVGKKKVLHEAEVLEITYKSLIRVC